MADQCSLGASEAMLHAATVQRSRGRDTFGLTCVRLTLNSLRLRLRQEMDRTREKGVCLLSLRLLPQGEAASASVYRFHFPQQKWVKPRLFLPRPALPLSRMAAVEGTGRGAHYVIK